MPRSHIDDGLPPADALFARAVRLQNQKMLAKALVDVSDISKTRLQTGVTTLVNSGHNEMVQDIMQSVAKPHQLLMGGDEFCPVYAAASSANASALSLFIDCWLQHMQSRKPSKKSLSRHDEMVEMVAFFTGWEQHKKGTSTLMDCLDRLVDHTDPVMLRQLITRQRLIAAVKQFHVSQDIVDVVERRMNHQEMAREVGTITTSSPSRRPAKL